MKCDQSENEIVEFFQVKNHLPCYIGTKQQLQQQQHKQKELKKNGDNERANARSLEIENIQYIDLMYILYNVQCIPSRLRNELKRQM